MQAHRRPRWPVGTLPSGRPDPCRRRWSSRSRAWCAPASSAGGDAGAPAPRDGTRTSASCVRRRGGCGGGDLGIRWVGGRIGWGIGDGAIWGSCGQRRAALVVPTCQVGSWPRRLMTHNYRGLQQSSREVKPKFIDSTQGRPKNICKP
jgi:hypothetical protein